MKPLFLTMLLTAFGFTLQAQQIQDAGKGAFIKTFQLAQQTNDFETLQKLLAKNPLITIPGRNGESQISKAEYLALLKQAGKEQQQCNVYVEMTAASDESFIAELKFVYTSYAFKNIIKAKQLNGEWKIISLKKSFFEAATSPVAMQ